MSKYFVYDPEGNGYEEFDTEEEALSAAKVGIDYYLSVDGWESEDVDQIRIGKVTHEVVDVDDSDEWSNYKIKEICYGTCC